MQDFAGCEPRRTYCPGRMHNYYGDIIEKLGEPTWWGERGVPRYCDFEPGEADNIYADQVALVRVECQGCGHPFDVCYSSDRFDTHLEDREDLEQYVRATVLSETFVDVGGVRPMRREFGYGDPPNVNCCSAGPTMTAVPRRILEFWREARSTGGSIWADRWQRVPELELDVTPTWSRERSDLTDEERVQADALLASLADETPAAGR